MVVQLGKHRHYKGGEYEVIGIANHSETMEQLVVYQALYNTPDLGPTPLFVRPLEMFLEEVEVDGILVKRFSKID